MYESVSPAPFTLSLLAHPRSSHVDISSHHHAHILTHDHVLHNINNASDIHSPFFKIKLKTFAVTQFLINNVSHLHVNTPLFSQMFSALCSSERLFISLAHYNDNTSTHKASSHSRIFWSSNLVHMVHSQPPVSTPSSPSVCCGAKSQSDASLGLASVAELV